MIKAPGRRSCLQSSALHFAVALLLVCCGRSVATDADSAPATTEPPDKLALIVAISDYPEEATGQWHDLPGAARDADLVKDLLTDSFGFPEHGIRVLRDDEATHEQIVRSFHDWLIEQAHEETEVVFWYSGHGSRVPDQSGRRRLEVDDMDSTLVAWDSRIDGRRGEFDVTDDEIGSLLKVLAKKTGRITIVTDSCNSAGTVRSGKADPAGQVVRALPDGVAPFDFDLVEPFWPEQVPFLEDTRRGADLDRYVHISACGERQRALEWRIPIGDGEVSYGALTWFLCDALRRIGSGTRYEQVARSVQRWVAARLPSQTVQYSGALDREVFGNRFSDREQGYTANHKFGTRTSVEINAGWIHGLRKGSILEMFGAYGAELGRVEIRSIGAIASVGIWQGTPPADLRDRALLGREVFRPGGRPPVLMAVQHEHLRQLIRERFADQVELVDPGAGAYQLLVEPADATPEQEARVLMRDPVGVRVGSREPQIGPGWLAKFEQEFGQRLGAERKYQAILALADCQGELRLEARFAPLLAADLKGPLTEGGEREEWTLWTPFDAEVVPIDEDLLGPATTSQYLALLPQVPTRIRPALARLDVSNRSDEEIYVYVLSLTEDRLPHVVYPTHRDEHIAWPKQVTRPAYVLLEADDRFSPERPMRDRYLVIATRRPADFWSLVKEATVRGGAGKLPGVPDEILEAFDGEATRSGKDPVSPGDFGIVAVDVLVSLPR